MKKRILNTIRELWKIGFLEFILVKLTTDKTYGSIYTKLPPNHYQYKAGSIRKIQHNGINYELDISDIMDWYVYFGFKDSARSKLYSLVNKGDIIFDVGANIGCTSLNFAKLIGKGGIIHSFEPDPINHNSIQKNISLNNFDNIILNKLGLGNEKGSFKIYTVDKNNKGMNRIVEFPDSIEDFKEIQVTTIDKYVRKNNIQKIDLIKIDVEGFELKVLKGSAEVLNNFHPSLFIELDNKNLKEQGSNAKDLIEYLLDNKYEIFHAETNERIHQNLNFDYCHYDIFAK